MKGERKDGRRERERLCSKPPVVGSFSGLPLHVCSVSLSPPARSSASPRLFVVATFLAKEKKVPYTLSRKKMPPFLSSSSSSSSSSFSSSSLFLFTSAQTPPAPPPSNSSPRSAPSSPSPPILARAPSSPSLPSSAPTLPPQLDSPSPPWARPCRFSRRARRAQSASLACSRRRRR